MNGGVRLGRGDLVVALMLLGTSVLIALPVLTRGYLTYIDNAVHLAEVYDLARPSSTGWSEIAFVGFPLGTLHSPLWYGALTFLTRHGAPLEVMYRAALLLGFVAPATALYYVARRRTTPLRAGLLAYLFLVQPPMIWGIGSPLGGMWTHTLSTAGLILLADFYSRESLSPREHLAASLVLSLTVLTHLFVLPIVALIALLTTRVHRSAKAMSDGELRWRTFGWTVAAAASAAYWLTLILVGDDAAAPHQNFKPLALLTRLTLPADAMYLLEDRIGESIRTDIGFVDAAPMLLVVGLGVFGYARHRSAPDALARIGFLLALFVFGLLLLDNSIPIRALGPVPFRQIEGVRMGLALAAVQGVSSLPLERWAGGTRALALAAAATLLGLLWGTPLRNENPDSVDREVADVRKLWDWLSANARPAWGRLYMQDTFGHDWQRGGIALSHVLTLTPHHVGMPQAGPYYGVIPFRLRWTLSEFNSLFTTREPSKAWLTEAMGKVNAGVLVTSNRHMTEHVKRMHGFETLHSVGRFTVFRRQDAENAPIAELSPANHVTGTEWSPDEIRFSLRTDYPQSRVLAKSSWHPWWHLSGIPGAWLRESPEGFLVIDDIPKGEFQVRLWYEPGTLPGKVSAVGVAALLAWGVFVFRRRAAPPPAAGARA